MPDILFERRGAAGIVTLNRPKALNAVTHDMVRALTRQLDRWAHDRGGDARRHHGGRRARVLGRRRYPRALRSRQSRPARRGATILARRISAQRAIKRYPKPYVALIDGIVMGGGVGVSVHGSHRVAGDRFQFAMPEVGIGFFPDVGATWFLPRMPGELGTYCALTGERFAQCRCSCGRPRHPPRSLHPLCRAARCTDRHAIGRRDARRLRRAGGRGTDRWRGAARSTGCSPATGSRTFSPRSTVKRVPRRNGRGKTAATIRTKSPLSLKLALAQVRRGKDVAISRLHASRIPHRVAHRPWLMISTRACAP